VGITWRYDSALSGSAEVMPQNWRMASSIFEREGNGMGEAERKTVPNGSG
jgi:hypothetical protein